MEFGKVNDPGRIDFRMPADDILTERVLGRLGAGSGQALRMHVGGTNWGTKGWLGVLYPRKTKEKDFLTHYARQLNTIELNTLFYNLQPVSVIEKWASMTDKSFRFCPKFSSNISHTLQLEGAERDTDLFVEHVRHFEERLGPSFLQLSDRFGPDRAVLLQRYLRRMPKDFQFCVELRHEDWFGEGSGAVRETWELLYESGIGTVITDTSGRRDCLHMKLTAPWVFVRFVANNLHATDFERLDAWAMRLRQWIDRGLREVYFFIHSHDELHSPQLARYAIETFNKVCGAGLRVPQLANGGEPENMSLF